MQVIPLPQLRREDGHLLYLAAGGPFTLRGARGTVTAERVVELRGAREGDRTGPLDSYNFLASQLPQDTRVLYHRWGFCTVSIISTLLFQAAAAPYRLQRGEVRPVAAAGRLGGQDAGAAQLEVLPHARQLSYRDAALRARAGPAINPLLMGPGLEQLQCWHCTCRAGLRTVSSCTHRNGALILLCATQCCDTAKVQECLYVDTARSVPSDRMTAGLFSLCDPLPQAGRPPAGGVGAPDCLPRWQPGRTVPVSGPAAARHPREQDQHRPQPADWLGAGSQPRPAAARPRPGEVRPEPRGGRPHRRRHRPEPCAAEAKAEGGAAPAAAAAGRRARRDAERPQLLFRCRRIHLPLRYPGN
jgi:hypothetical protein